MSYIVYILKSEVNQWIYVGMTSDFPTRLKRHQKGGVPSSKPYKPFTVIATEVYPNAKTARTREKWLKGRSGKRWIYKTFNPY